MISTSPPEGASGQSPKSPRPKRQPRPVPTTLSEFLLAERASARRFIKLIIKRPPLSDDDLARSHEIISEHPSKIGKVVELARAAASAVPHPGVILYWCEQVERSRDEALRGWALDPGQDARAAFGDLLTWAVGNIRKKRDRPRRQLAESCLALGLTLLLARRSLAPLDALRSIALVEAGLREARRGASPEREAAKVLVGASVKQLFELARIVNLSETEIGSAENARRNAVSLADELRQQKEAIEEERDRLNAKIRDLDRDIIERDSRIADLAADLQGSKIRALQDLSNLKARFRRQIGEGLAGLLADAWDAIDTDPPHPDVARERLEIAREAIRRELEWLDKSSD